LHYYLVLLLFTAEYLYFLHFIKKTLLIDPNTINIINKNEYI